MTEQILNDVLTEILGELREANQSLKTLQTTLQNTQEKVTGFDEKLTGQQVIAPPADTTAIQELVQKAAGDIAAIVEAQPKNVVKRYQLSFFPEHDHHGNYKHLINKFAQSLILIVLIGASLSLGSQYIEKAYPANKVSESSQPPTPSDRVTMPPGYPDQSRDPLTPYPATKQKTRHHSQKELQEYLDTLYKKYMHKKPDSLYEFR